MKYHMVAESESDTSLRKNKL